MEKWKPNAFKTILKLWIWLSRWPRSLPRLPKSATGDCDGPATQMTLQRQRGQRLAEHRSAHQPQALLGSETREGTRELRGMHARLGGGGGVARETPPSIPPPHSPPPTHHPTPHVRISYRGVFLRTGFCTKLGPPGVTGAAGSWVELHGGTGGGPGGGRGASKPHPTIGFLVVGCSATFVLN